MLALAFQEAHTAFERGEIPVGCVFVRDDGVILGSGGNTTNEERNATNHAEILVIDKILRENGNDTSVFQNVDMFAFFFSVSFFILVFNPC